MSVEKIKLKHNSPEWLAFRRKGIGASDAAAVLGLSKWTTNVELWEEKVGLRQPKNLSDNEHVRYGTAAETPLVKLFALQYNTLSLTEAIRTNERRKAERQRVIEAQKAAAERKAAEEQRVAQEQAQQPAQPPVKEPEQPKDEDIPKFSIAFMHTLIPNVFLIPRNISVVSPRKGCERIRFAARNCIS